jgi:Mn2+/Fe2+ NRAMP family transporter
MVVPKLKKRFYIFMAVLGPAVITAMADNDASGVATYSIAGATLGYPILFILLLVTLLLAVTQEMGVRLALVTRKGLGDLIRENFGVKISIFIFLALFLANMGTIVVDVSAVKIASSLLHLPSLPMLILMIILSIVFVVRGNYKLNQSIMLLSSLFYLTYVVSAFKAKPDWGLAVSNLFFPRGVGFSAQYWKEYLLIAMGVLGTTITPWGQFFISSFTFDKKIDMAKLKYSQLEAYIGAFLTDFFSFFMIVATAATLFVHKIPLVSGEQAALAIQPFAGELAGVLFALGILNAGFMGFNIVALSTAYAFTEFFGYSGSLDMSFQKSRSFYYLFVFQLLVAALVTIIPFVSLFKLAIVAQTVNALMLPLVFYFLIRLTNDPSLMGSHANNRFQRYFAIGSTVVILIASVFTLLAYLFRW